MTQNEDVKQSENGRSKRLNEQDLEAIRKVLTAQVDQMLRAAHGLREETAAFLAEGGFSG